MDVSLISCLLEHENFSCYNFKTIRETNILFKKSFNVCQALLVLHVKKIALDSAMSLSCGVMESNAFPVLQLSWCSLIGCCIFL